ncbi:hypothetical protein ACN38_g13030, partial [Penicillium nordicum]
SCSLCGP